MHNKYTQASSGLKVMSWLFVIPSLKAANCLESIDPLPSSGPLKLLFSWNLFPVSGMCSLVLVMHHWLLYILRKDFKLLNHMVSLLKSQTISVQGSTKCYSLYHLKEACLSLGECCLLESYVYTIRNCDTFFSFFFFVNFYLPWNSFFHSWVMVPSRIICAFQ